MKRAIPIFVLVSLAAFQSLQCEEIQEDLPSSIEEPADANLALSGEIKTVKQRKVSVEAGPKGKVVWFFDSNIGMAYGNALVKYEDVVLRADEVWADMDSEVVEARGNVILQTKEQQLHSEHMLFDLKNKKGTLLDGLSLDQPWYYRGFSMSRLSESESFIEKGSMTSCNLNRPHYVFEASQIVIHLKKELVAKNVVFRIGGVPLLYLPVYRRSLEPDKRAKFVFKLGSSAYEGYYVKNILPIRWKMFDGNAFLNITSRRGINGGTDINYNADKVRLREIFIPVSKDATNEEWQRAKNEINEIYQRAQGQLDKVEISQIFIKYQISNADKMKALERAQKVLKEAKEGSDFAQLARRWSDDKSTKGKGGDLGYFIISDEGITRKEDIYSDVPQRKSVEPEILPVIETAAKLRPGEISDIIETDDGYHIVKLDHRDKNEIRVRHIFLMFEPTEGAQKSAQMKADEVLSKLSSKVTFEDLAKVYSDDKMTKDKGGYMGWMTFSDFDLAFHNIIRTLNVGEVSRPIVTPRGIYIIKLLNREKTPEFAELARQYSRSPSAKAGGDIGFKSRWELPPEVRREAYRMDLYDISKPIKCEDGYRIVRMEKKRNLGGEIYLQYGDLYSYQVEKNPIKMGQTWDFNIRHRQVLWRGSEWEEYDPRFGGSRLRREKLLEMRAELSFAGDIYKQVYQSYNPERELRSYWALDYYWMSRTRSSGHAGIIVDGTKDLLGQDTYALQKYPEISYRPPDFRLTEVKFVKRINSILHSVSDKIQGKSSFAEMVRQFSDDEKTRDKDGYVGWVEKENSGLNYKIETVVFDPNELEKGDISRPILTDEGFYIFKIEDVREKAGKREKVKLSQIFIAIDPKIRNKDQASKISDDIYRKLVEGERPSLGFPTLDNTSLSFDSNIGNYFKESYQNENNIWLQTADANVSFGKRATIRFGVLRELYLDLSGDYRLIWNSKTQPVTERDIQEGLVGWKIGERDYNVFTSVWSFRSSLSTNLYRIFYPTFIPMVSAFKHTFSPYVRFSYAPESQDGKAYKREPSLYPFGPGAWTYGQKRLSGGMTNTIDIKTRYKRERIPIFRWDLSVGADYTREPGYVYEDLRNTFSIRPSRNASFDNVLTYNLNNLGTGKPIFSNFSSELRYYDPEGKWSGNIYRRHIYYSYSNKSQQFFGIALSLNWSKTWSLRFDFEYEYDKQVKDISNVNIYFSRNLHCWESRIGFNRRGTRIGYLTRDFYFSLNIIADPGKTIGVGYDDVSRSWTLQSLPGMGRFGRYIGGSRYIGY